MVSDAERRIARRSTFYFRLFALYLRWYVGRRFHAVRISRNGVPHIPPGPLIVYSNHPSWWDPTVYILANDILFRGRAGFGPMDQTALGRYGLLERMGVFGVAQNDPRGGVQFLRTCAAILARPGTMLWITAEGEFTDPRVRPITLRVGLAHLARRVPGATILPLALDYTFWNESRPEILLRFGTPLYSSRDGNIPEWTQRLEHALTETMDDLAAESVTRNAALFTPLIQGFAGVGGIYDIWRRMRAMAAGRRFDPSHEGEI
jgi:1-acyl-sn-glycerol-3-phosphate acyltransferase